MRHEPGRWPGGPPAIGWTVASPAVLSVALLATGTGCRNTGQGSGKKEPVALTGRARLIQDARALKPMVRSGWVRRFLDATRRLPRITTRRLRHDAARRHYYTEAQAGKLRPVARRALKTLVVDEEYYYSTGYGSPLAYSRVLDILAAHGFPGIAGRRVLDFGYGKIGHLRLMAENGTRVTGVDVHPSLPLVYGRPGDQGRVSGGGEIRLVHGRFPADPAVRRAVGTGYDLITAKNTLKKGYVHPAQPIKPHHRIDLGVNDARFVAALFSVLKPGGYLAIYNLHPRQNPPDRPYIPWADGQTPFARRLCEAAGFEVLVFDQDDTAFARKMGHTLGWHRGRKPMDLKNDLFATYSLFRKPQPQQTRTGP